MLIEYLMGNYNLITDKEKLFDKAIFDNVINKFTIYDYNYEKLFNIWIEPIEPDDIINYHSILERKINEENVEIDGLVYTDVLCYRNFIQYEYQTGL
jgi:hypothetical protein